MLSKFLCLYELHACGFYLFMYISGQFRQGHMTSGNKMEKMWLSLAWGVTDIPLPWHLSFRSAPLLISTQTAWIINPSNLPLHAPPVATTSSGHTHLNSGSHLVYSKMIKINNRKFFLPPVYIHFFKMPNISFIAWHLAYRLKFSVVNN